MAQKPVTMDCALAEAQKYIDCKINTIDADVLHFFANSIGSSDDFALQLLNKRRVLNLVKAETLDPVPKNSKFTSNRGVYTTFAGEKIAISTLDEVLEQCNESVLFENFKTEKEVIDFYRDKFVNIWYDDDYDVDDDFDDEDEWCQGTRHEDTFTAEEAAADDKLGKPLGWYTISMDCDYSAFLYRLNDIVDIEGARDQLLSGHAFLMEVDEEVYYIATAVS